MNKDTFFTMSPQKRVEEVNKLLQKYDLNNVAKQIGLPYSTFTKEMRRVGNFFYHQTDKQYYTFIRNKYDKPGVGDAQLLTKEESFLKENLEDLERLIKMFQTKQLFLLNERIYSKQGKFENKSIKMNKEIYKEFTEFCDENFPHLKMQDLIAQSLLDFIDKYKR